MASKRSNRNGVAMRHSAVRPMFIAASVAALVLAACGGGESDTVDPSAVALATAQSSGRPIVITPGSDVIAYWSQIAASTVNVPAAATGTPEERRPVYNLDLATVHVPMFNAVNAIDGPYQRFAAQPTTATAGATLEAASAGSPRSVWEMVGIFPAVFLSVGYAICFAFTPFFFNGICSDLSRVRVADAVAASMAVPVLFRPVLAESFPDADCPDLDWPDRVLSVRTSPESARAAARAFRNYRRDPRANQRFVLLSDGGLVDYFGLLSLSVMHAAGPPPASFTAREAVQARRVLVLVVNAEYIRPRTFQQRETDAIGPYEMIYAAMDAATAAAMRSYADAFRANLPELERQLRDFRCGLEPRQLSDLGGVDVDWSCREISVAMDVIAFRDMSPEAYDALFNTRTDVSLESETVTALIASGRAAVAGNEAVRALRR